MRACVFTYMCGGAHEIDLVLSHFILDFFFLDILGKIRYKMKIFNLR